MLRCQDIEMLSLDLHGVVAKCPDMTEEQLARLLALRGDVPRAHVRECVAIARAAPQAAAAPAAPRPPHAALFQNITFSDRLLGHFAL